MQDLNDKITGGTLSAGEWNEVPSELQNVIENLGQTLTPSDLNQVGKAICSYSMAGPFLVDSSVAANIYTLGTIGSKQGPPNLGVDFDGALVRFRSANNNSGASTTAVNGLVSKDIVREDGSALVSGDLVTTQDAHIRWDQSADDFRLLNFAIAGAVEVPRGYIDGLILSPGADAIHDIDFGVGICRDNTGVNTMNVDTTFFKRTDAAGGWVAGTNQVGLPDVLDPVAVDTWLHCFLLKNPSNGLVDGGFDTNIIATNLLAEATGYTLFRRIGSVKTDGSSEIIPFTQYGNHFVWDDGSRNDVNISNQGTGEVPHTLQEVPLGIRTWAEISVVFGRPNTASDTAYLVGNGDDTLSAPVLNSNLDARTRGDGRYSTWHGKKRTDLVQLVKTRQSLSDSSATLSISVHGWEDDRESNEAT